ncbi:uncharacterized protein LOC119079472 [Bradysia coprophila]|uniref:uncharacterized protein LOC119079472 n=1 Tax=Bradysia coprophila TaxID=38358 RepID=UPI00187DD009|nr:uncharacterized protein LOC119079472 [Bradysia coprophila]
MKIEPQASVVDPHPVRCAEHSDVQLKTKIKVELVECDPNETYSSDVQIIELPPEEPIEISDDETQLLCDQLQVDRNDTKDLVVSQSTSSKKLSAASTSKGSLNIAVEPVQNNLSVDCQALSQQSFTHPLNWNFQIEERTMTESQHQ